jgi:hypothetical protein
VICGGLAKSLDDWGQLINLALNVGDTRKGRTVTDKGKCAFGCKIIYVGLFMIKEIGVMTMTF